MEDSCHLLGASSSSPSPGGHRPAPGPSLPHHTSTGQAGQDPSPSSSSTLAHPKPCPRAGQGSLQAKRCLGVAVGKDTDPLDPESDGQPGEGACRLREGGSAGKEQRGRCGAADKPARNNKRLHYTSVLAGESGRRPATGPRSARHPQRGQRSGCWHEERDPLGLRVGERRAGCSGRDKKDKIEEKPAGHVTCGTFGQATSGPADASSGP